MARRPQRADRWSLRQVALVAGVSRPTARSAAAAGHLDPDNLTERDVLVLRVVSMLPALQPFGELRPANVAREVPARDVDAVALVREAGGPLPAMATLIVTAESATLARSIAAVSAATLEAAEAGQPYLALPVGQWSLELENRTRAEAAA